MDANLVNILTDEIIQHAKDLKAYANKRRRLTDDEIQIAFSELNGDIGHLQTIFNVEI